MKIGRHFEHMTNLAVDFLDYCVGVRFGDRRLGDNFLR